VGLKRDESEFDEEEKVEITKGDPPDGHIPESSFYTWWAGNEAPGTAHDLDTKDLIDVLDAGTSSGDKHMISHLRGPDISPGAEPVGSQARPPNMTSQRRSRARAIRPGAERVYGLGNRGLEEGDEQMTVVSLEESILPVFGEAELVNTEEEEKRRREEIMQAIQKDRQRAIVGEIVPEVAPDNSHRRLKLASLFLLLISIAIGVVLGITLRPGPTPAPTPSPEAFLNDLLSSVSFDSGDALLTNSTPQNKALKWLANDTNLESYSNETIVRRYVLATLYYSANGDSWSNHDLWLDNGKECNRWSGITCTHTTDAVSMLACSDNNLTGTIPPEIGLLDSIGKCVPRKKAGQCIPLAPNAL
jgi:hypothetical protein